jgi:hypothetical protein
MVLDGDSSLLLLDDYTRNIHIKYTLSPVQQEKNNKKIKRNKNRKIPYS